MRLEAITEPFKIHTFKGNGAGACIQSMISDGHSLAAVNCSKQQRNTNGNLQLIENVPIGVASVCCAANRVRTDWKIF